MIFATIIFPNIMGGSLPNSVAYILFLLRMVGVGMCLNLMYIIIGTRLNPMLLGTSLELCFCLANLVAAIQPILANLDEPVPLATATSIFILAVTTGSTFGEIATNTINIEQTLVSLAIEKDFLSQMSSEQQTKVQVRTKNRLNNILA